MPCSFECFAKIEPEYQLQALRVRTSEVPWGNAAHRDFVCSRFSDHIRGAKQRFECSRVGPPSIQDAMRERAFPEIHVIYIGDFEFIAKARFGLADLGKDSGIVKINSSNRELGLGGFGFFFNF